jgi:hypothetical protein
MRRFVVTPLSAAAVACGGTSSPNLDPPRDPMRPSSREPRMPPSAVAQRVLKSLGDAPQNCGEAVQGLDDRSCRMQPVHECLLRAFEVCRPAYGTHMYATAEGDPIRVDYYVRPSSGPCAFLVVDDKTADPVGRKEVQELECKKIEWKPDVANPDCQTLQPLECTTLSTTPRG